MSLADEKFVSFTTYKRNGEPKSLPVWIVDVGDGKLGFTTASSSYKVKRVRNDDRCTLQPSDRKGAIREGTAPVSGRAEIRSGADFEPVKALVKKKYGFQFTMIAMMGKIAQMVGKGSGSDTAIIVTLD